MLSRNNVELMNQRNSKQRQRFGIRKLTVGVASVLLGTTFFMGTAYAETNSTSVTTPSGTPTLTGNGQVQPSSMATAKLNNTSNADEQVGGSTTQSATLVSPSTPVEYSVSDDSTGSTVTGLSFTGSVSGFNNTTSGKASTDDTFNAGDTADLTYTMRSSGDNSTLQNGYWPVKSDYLAMLPAGFKLNSWETSFDQTDYQITPLGQVGPNGEYVYLIALNKTPYYGIPVSFTAHMIVTNDAETNGNHDYNWFPIPGLLMAINANNLFDSNHSITLGGHPYNVTNCSYFLHGNGLGSEVKYTVIPGTTPLAVNNYQVTNLTSVKKDVTGPGNAGYEEIDPTINITGTVNPGDYLDFHLGIPYTDNESGQTEYEAYDNKLSANFDVANIGRVYNMGSYYRLVFNDVAGTLNNPTFNLQLRWGSGDNQASLNKWWLNYVYQETDDPSKDHTGFTYTPTNDVNINGQTMASGLSVNGTYVYTKKAIGVGNQHINAGASSNYNRTWNQQGDVAVNTSWSNTEAANLSTTDTGNEFDLKTTITKDPSGLVNFTFTTADEMKKAIENDIVTNDTQKLVNGVVNDNGKYVKLNTTKGEKPKVNVDVTRTITTDPNDSNKITAIWHIKLTNVDPATNPKIVLGGSVVTVSATANNFTMPNGITSYNQDLAQSINTGTYNGAKTGNEALMNVLKNLPIATTQFVSYKDGQPDVYSGIFGGPWTASIAYAGDSNVDGGGSASDLVTDTISFEDANTKEKLASDLSYQGATGTNIHFNGLQNTFNSLSGYQFVKAVSVKNGQETELTNFDPTKLDSYPFGTASKNKASQYIIYVRQALTAASATITYFDDTTGNVLNADTVNGDVGDTIQFATTPSNQIKAYKKQGYVLISNDFTDGSKYVDGNNKFTVHLKHGVKDYSETKTVTRKVNYVIIDGGTTAPAAQTQTATFTGTGHQDAVNSKLVDLNSDGSFKKNTDGTIAKGTLTWTPRDASFAEVDSPAVAGYHIVSVESQTTDQVDGNNIKKIKVNPNLKDITVTVTYAPNRDEVATLHFVDDDNDGTQIADAITAHGAVNTQINFGDVASVVNHLIQSGYVLHNTTDDTPMATEALIALYAATEGKQIGGKQDTDWANLFGEFATQGGQTFTIHFNHRHDPLVATHQRTVMETIHYVYNDAGHTQAAADAAQTLTFDGTGYHDAVTNQDVVTDWQLAGGTTDEGSFAAVDNPDINGYHIVSATDASGNDVLDTENNSVRVQTGLTHRSTDLEMTVVYAIDPQPTQPTTPDVPSGQPTPSDHPTTPNVPSDRPTIPAVPSNQPSSNGPITVVPDDQSTPNTPTVALPADQPVDHLIPVNTPVQGQEKSNMQRLPQTGNANDGVVVGLGLTSLFTMLGVLIQRRKRN